MKRKVKFALFLLVGTVVNVLITALCLILLFFIYAVFILPHLSPEAANVGGPLLLIASLVLAFFVYRKLVKVVMKKNPFDIPEE